MDASTLAGSSSSGSSLNLLSLFTPDWAALGTGLKPLSQKSDEMMGTLPDDLQKMVVSQLPALFGDYPEKPHDIAPSAVFIAIFGLLFLINIGGFGFNWTRGHKFYASAGLAFHSLCKVIGYGLRVKWAGDVLNVPLAVASVVFVQVPPLILCVMNMYFASRVFTWRHPEAGRSLWFKIVNTTIYCLVVGVIVMAILGTALPNIYYMSQGQWRKCQQVAEAASVLQLVYALSGVLMLGAAYMFKPGKIDHKFVFGNKDKTEEDYPLVAQPTWIQSFSPVHFVSKGAQGLPGTNDKLHRVIATDSKPAHGLVRVHGLHECAGKQSISVVNLIIATGSMLLLLLSCFRCAAMFIHKERGGNGEPLANVVFSSTILYVFYGAVEALVNIFWFIVRVDLRFYVPDAPRKDAPVVDNETVSSGGEKA